MPKNSSAPNMASQSSNGPVSSGENCSHDSCGCGTSKNEEFLGAIFTRMMMKDEIAQIPQFYATKSITSHLILVEEKMSVLKLFGQSKTEFLLATLHEDIRLELCSLSDYSEKKCDYDWLKDTLMKQYKKENSKVSSFISLMDIKQSPKQTLREFLSTVRIEGYKLFF